MDLEVSHGFSQYEASTFDPGWSFTLFVVTVCTLVNLSLPILVSLARAWNRKRGNLGCLKSFGAKHSQLWQPLPSDDYYDDEQPIYPNKHTPKTTSNLVAPSQCGSDSKTISSMSSTDSSSASDTLDDQMPTSAGLRINTKRITDSPSLCPSRSSPHMIDVEDNEQGSNNAATRTLDHNAVDKLDYDMIDSNASKGHELDDPSSLWYQFLEIANWDAESQRLVALTIPYAVQGCTRGLFQTINVAFIGHNLGVMEANAYVVVTTLLEFSQTITHGFAEVVGTIVPHAEGADNNLLAGRYLQLSLIMCAITSVPSVILWSFCMYQVVLWFGFDEETALISQQFACPFLLHMFLTGLDDGIHSFLNVTGHEKYSTIVQILHHVMQTGTVIIVVILGVKDLFYVGSVLAFLALLVSLANVMFVVHRGWVDKYWEGLVQTLSLRDGPALETTLMTAIPLACTGLLTYGEWELLTIFARSMGPAEVAAWGMLGFIWEILGHVTEGFADAAVYRVGFRLGAGQPHDAKVAAYKAVYLGIVAAALSAGGLFAISGYIPGWLTPDPTLQRMIFDCLPLIGFGQISMIIGTVTWGIVGAQGRIRLATTVEFMSSWFIAIPLCAISHFVLNYNLMGFVGSLIFGYTVGGAAVGVIILTSDWGALSRDVVAKNAIEGVTWEDDENDDVDEDDCSDASSNGDVDAQGNKENRSQQSISREIKLRPKIPGCESLEWKGNGTPLVEINGWQK